MKTLGTAGGFGGRNRVREAGRRGGRQGAMSGDLNVLLRRLSIFPLIASLRRLG